MSTVNEIVELSERICHRIDEIILMDRKMNDEMMTYLEHMGWNMEKQVSEIKELYERYGE
jgi:hypothetical protein